MFRIPFGKTLFIAPLYIVNGGNSVPFHIVYHSCRD